MKAMMMRFGRGVRVLMLVGALMALEVRGAADPNQLIQNMSEDEMLARAIEASLKMGPAPPKKPEPKPDASSFLPWFITKSDNLAGYFVFLRNERRVLKCRVCEANQDDMKWDRKTDVVTLKAQICESNDLDEYPVKCWLTLKVKAPKPDRSTNPPQRWLTWQWNEKRTGRNNSDVVWDVTAEKPCATPAIFDQLQGRARQPSLSADEQLARRIQQHEAHRRARRNAGTDEQLARRIQQEQLAAAGRTAAGSTMQTGAMRHTNSNGLSGSTAWDQAGKKITLTKVGRWGKDLPRWQTEKLEGRVCSVQEMFAYNTPDKAVRVRVKLISGKTMEFIVRPTDSLRRTNLSLWNETTNTNTWWRISEK